MDPEVLAFRRAAARENRERRDGGRRYSTTLQQRAVAYWTARDRAGDGLQDVAMALGLPRQTLQRWTRARFHPIAVTSDPPTSAAAPVLVISEAGLRVEGLDLEGLVQLVTRLR